MNKNYAIGFLVLVLVLLGSYLIFRNNGVLVSNESVATTTPQNSNPYQAPVSGQQATRPLVETDAKAVPSNSTVVLTGRVIPNGAPTVYWYEYGTTSALGSRTTSQSVGSGFNKIPSPAYITGLQANKTYYFRLSAQNNFGTVSGSIFSFMTNNNPSPTGSAPTTSTSPATDVSRTTANLNGRVDPNSAESNFWFEYGLDQELGSVTAFQSAGNGDSSSAVSVSLSELSPLTKYYFRLNAQNQFGTVNGAIISFTTKGPTSPAVPAAPTVNTTSASNITNSSVTFNGRINPNGAVTTYWFEYSDNSLLGSIVGTVTSTQTINGNDLVAVNLNQSGLRKDTDYFYRLVGRNQYGTVLGDIVSFKTKK